MTMEKVKFVSITRTICPKTQIHYLDGITDDGKHYVAEMKSGIERWLVFTSAWKKSGQVPYKNT